MTTLKDYSEHRLDIKVQSITVNFGDSWSMNPCLNTLLTLYINLYKMVTHDGKTSRHCFKNPSPEAIRIKLQSLGIQHYSCLKMSSQYLKSLLEENNITSKYHVGPQISMNE